MSHLLRALAFAALLAASGAHAAPPPKPGTTVRMADDASAWRADPHMKTFYEASKAAFAAGPDKVDFTAYEAKSRQIFIEFAIAHGIPPEHMLDHLKLIPGQVVKIVKDDPHVLDSYDTFADALFGPD